jgi:hypothetical protein
MIFAILHILLICCVKPESLLIGCHIHLKLEQFLVVAKEQYQIVESFVERTPG